MHESLEKSKLHISKFEPDCGSFAIDMSPREPGFTGPCVECFSPVVNKPRDRGLRVPVMSQSGGWVSDSSGSASSSSSSSSSSGHSSGSNSSSSSGRSSTSGGRTTSAVRRTASRTSDIRAPVDDIKCLNSNLLMLRTCGYYYEGISRQEAKDKLRQCSVGTFLLRDSADPKYLFSLSVKTPRGITSVRLEYRAGRWRMDCEDRLVNQMPEFNNVVELVDFYIKLSRNDSQNQCVWLESCGRRDTPVKLVRPVRKAAVSLQHACRLTIAKHVNSRDIQHLNLPNPMKNYLHEYSYSH